MFTEPDETIRRLQHEKNVWRGIAIGLVAVLILLMALGAIGGVFLARRSQLQAARADEAAMRAMQERDRAAAEARRAAEKQKAKPAHGRMFERLRTRAQVFDILTGGDPTADQESGAFWLDPASEGEDDGTSFVPLPRQMLDDLRVNLAVRIDS